MKTTRTYSLTEVVAWFFFKGDTFRYSDFDDRMQFWSKPLGECSKKTKDDEPENSEIKPLYPAVLKTDHDSVCTEDTIGIEFVIVGDGQGFRSCYMDYLWSEAGEDCAEEIGIKDLFELVKKEYEEYKKEDFFNKENYLDDIINLRVLTLWSHDEYVSRNLEGFDNEVSTELVGKITLAQMASALEKKV